MANLNFDFIVPGLLTGYIRTAMADYADNQFSLARWLPYRTVNDLDYRTMVGNTGLADAAVYRTYDAESPIARRPGLTQLRGELPPMSLKVRLGEYDRLRNRALANQEIESAIYDDAERLAKNIVARFELARADALLNGTITINENGVSSVIDYQRPGSHTVTASTLWTGAADPLADLMAWRDIYHATNGIDPEAIVTSRRVMNLLLRNQAVRNQVFPGANQPSIVTQANVNQLLESQGLPPIYTYNATVNISKVATKVIPDNKLLMLPAAGDPNDPQSSQLGGTFLGTTAESLEPEYGLEEDQPGLVAGVYKDNDPIALWTKVAAIGVPVLANAALSFAATVA